MKTLRTLPLLFLFTACGGENNLFSGSIEIDEVRISARVGGQVEQLAVHEGDPVLEGQLLVKLDEAPYLLALERSEAALAGAEAALGTLLEGTREQQIISASAGVQAARAGMVQSESDLSRARELFAAGALSQRDLQAAETAAVVAETRYDSAWQSYSLAAEGARSTEIMTGEASVASAEAAMRMVLQELEWTSVISPLSGTVTGTDVLAGENVSQGMTLLTVASMDTVRVIFYVPEPYLARIHPGEPLEVLSTEGTPVTGVLSRISDRAEFTPSTVETRDGRTSLVYRVEGIVPNASGVFKAGMPVDVVLAESW